MKMGVPGFVMGQIEPGCYSRLSEQAMFLCRKCHLTCNHFDSVNDSIFDSACLRVFLTASTTGWKLNRLKNILREI